MLSFLSLLQLTIDRGMEVSHLRASRRAHHAHLTRVFGKISSVLESDKAPNERDTAILQSKKLTVTELDTKIQEAITDADTLETTY